MDLQRLSALVLIGFLLLPELLSGCDEVGSYSLAVLSFCITLASLAQTLGNTGGLSGRVACRIFPDRGWILCLLHC